MKKRHMFLFGVGVITSFCYLSCTGNSITTADSGEFLSDFHEMNFREQVDVIAEDSLALYVDYSTCIALGQNSPFFNKLIPSFVNATRTYYSIKGNDIAPETGSVFQLLQTIQEVNYADLKSAIEKMADGKTESVLLTDGEFYQQSIAKGNINNPYMADAFKKWLNRGHDIYILSEPYVETNKGKQFNKKRFYIFFTDSRLRGNIYDRILQTVHLEDFQEVELFHLSADHPALLSDGGEHSVPNPTLEAKVKGYGSYEIQDWPLDWKDGVEPLIVNAVDEQTGQPLSMGGCITGGLKVDRNSFGGFRIAGISAKVYPINEEYTSFYNAKIEKAKINKESLPLNEVANFIKLDGKEFKTHGNIVLHFDTEMYDPSLLNGSPFNYFKVDICVSEVQSIFEQFAKMFEFDSIDVEGENNVSLAASIQQCMADPSIQAKISSCSIYTIYVKSSER